MGVRIERETTIVWNDEEEFAKVWSASPIFQRHMAKLGVKPLRTAPSDGPYDASWYSIPKKWVKIRLPVKRTFTPEQKRRLAEATRARFQAARNAKKRKPRNRPF